MSRRFAAPALAQVVADISATKSAGLHSLHLLTGDRATGKTTWCYTLARTAQTVGMNVAGIVCPGIEGTPAMGKIAIAALDLQSGQRRLLATRREAPTVELGQRSFHRRDADTQADTRHLSSVHDTTVTDADIVRSPVFQAGDTPAKRIGAWVFVQSTIAWVNGRLADVQDCDLLVIDELGPLELEDGEGFQEALAVLQRRPFAFAVVVVRPELVKRALQRWPDAAVFDATGALQVHSRVAGCSAGTGAP